MAANTPPCSTTALRTPRRMGFTSFGMSPLTAGSTRSRKASPTIRWGRYRRSICLNSAIPSSSKHPSHESVTITLWKLAPIFSSRGLMSTSALSSVEMYQTRIGSPDIPPSGNGLFPRLKLAAIESMNIVFPHPGSPSMRVISPRGMSPSTNHSMGWATTSCIQVKGIAGTSSTLRTTSTSASVCPASRCSTQSSPFPSVADFTMVTLRAKGARLSATCSALASPAESLSAQMMTSIPLNLSDPLAVQT